MSENVRFPILKAERNGKYMWIYMYTQLINKYNNGVHRTIKMSLSNAYSSNEKQVLQTSYNHPQIFVSVCVFLQVQFI